MTFKLEIGTTLVREERSPTTQSGSDLVRIFRRRMRLQSESSLVAAKGKPTLTLVNAGKPTVGKLFGR